MAKEKIEIFECVKCIHSIKLKSLNCKLRMKDKKETECSKVDKVKNCIWFRQKGRL